MGEPGVSPWFTEEAAHHRLLVPLAARRAAPEAYVMYRGVPPRGSEPVPRPARMRRDDGHVTQTSDPAVDEKGAPQDEEVRAVPPGRGSRRSHRAVRRAPCPEREHGVEPPGGSADLGGSDRGQHGPVRVPQP